MNENDEFIDVLVAAATRLRTKLRARAGAKIANATSPSRDRGFCPDELLANGRLTVALGRLAKKTGISKEELFKAGAILEERDEEYSAKRRAKREAVTS